MSGGQHGVFEAFKVIFSILFIIAVVSIYIYIPSDGQRKYFLSSGGTPDENQYEKDILYVCDNRQLCISFSRARQECATAGDVNECIYIKSGIYHAQNCSDKGELIDHPANIAPGELQCYITQFKYRFLQNLQLFGK